MEGFYEALPANLKEQHRNREIEVGDVYYMRVEGVDHPKYFIVVGKHENNVSLATVYVNTEDTYYELNPTLRSLQKEALKEDYDFLKYNSYIDCSNIIPRNISLIQDTFNRDKDIFVGVVNDNQVDDIIRNLIDSPNVKGKTCKRYGFYDRLSI